METENISLVEKSLELVKRHGGLHKVNIKYGYILFGLSILFITIRGTAIWYYQRGWKKSGRSTTNLRLSHVPLPITISLLTLTVAILLGIKPHLEKTTVVIKRLGRLSYALLPLDIFLAAKPAWFPMDNYLNTIPLHKWISRLIVLLAIIHSISFLVHWGNAGTMTKMFRVKNFLGVIIFIFANVMMIFWKPIRDFNYKLFYIYHNFFVILMIFLTYFHARPGVSFYFLINIVLLVAGITRKYMFAKDITLTEIIDNPGSDLKIVKFPKSLLPENYLPAGHVRIGYSKWSPFFALLPSHPYTVVSIFENRNLSASLVIKKSKFDLEPFETYSIQSLYKSSLSENFFNSADNVNIVCGGSGISFGLGIFEYFKRCIIADGRDIRLKIIWITKHEEDLFILQELNIEGVEVFITNSDDNEFDSADGFNENDNTDENDIPLSALSNASQDSLASLDHKFTNVVRVGRRPNLEVILNKNLSKTIDYANKWILACGPKSLNDDCGLIASKQKCRFFSEEYSF